MSIGDGGGSETYRVFIAVSLPEHVKDDIERAQEQLRCTLPGKYLRWARRDQLHLTLKFLGDVELQRLEGLTASIRGACAGFGVLQLRAGQIGFFPNVRRPRVVWTLVRDGRDRLPPCNAQWKRRQPGSPVKRPNQSSPAMSRWGGAERSRVGRLKCSRCWPKRPKIQCSASGRPTALKSFVAGVHRVVHVTRHWPRSPLPYH